MEKFCVYCGKEITEDAKFCIYCGKAVRGREAANPVPENARPVPAAVPGPEEIPRKPRKKTGLIIGLSAAGVAVTVAVAVFFLTKDSRTIEKARELAYAGEYAAAIETLEDVRKPQKTAPVLREIHELMDTDVLAGAEALLTEKKYRDALSKLTDLYDETRGDSVRGHVPEAIGEDITALIENGQFRDAEDMLVSFSDLLSAETVDQFRSSVTEKITEELITLSADGKCIEAAERLTEYKPLLSSEKSGELYTAITDSMEEEISALMDGGNYVGAQDKFDEYCSYLNPYTAIDIQDEIRFESLILQSLKLLEKRSHIWAVISVDDAEAIRMLDTGNEGVILQVCVNSTRWIPGEAYVMMLFPSSDIAVAPVPDMNYYADDSDEIAYIEDTANMLAIGELLETAETEYVFIDLIRINAVIASRVPARLDISRYQ